MRLASKIRLGLAAKVAVCVIASTAAFFTFFGYLNLRMQRKNAEELVKLSAYRISDIISRSTRYEMLHDNRQALLDTIREIGSEPGIQRIRIFNDLGRITLSTDRREVNTVVDKTAEACFGCHAQSAPLTKPGANCGGRG